MDAIELLKLLEEKTGISPLVFSDEGVLSFIFNKHYTTHIEKSNDDCSLTVYGIAGNLPSQNRDLCLMSILEANLFSNGTAGASFGIDSETKEIILFKVFDILNVERDAFFDEFKQFLITQQHWTTQIETKAYEASGEIKHISPPLGNPFIRM